jgi:hypothetical protein
VPVRASRQANDGIGEFDDVGSVARAPYPFELARFVSRGPSGRLGRVPRPAGPPLAERGAKSHFRQMMSPAKVYPQERDQ